MWWENKGRAKVIGKRRKDNKFRLEQSSKALPIASCFTFFFFFMLSYWWFSSPSIPYEPRAECRFRGPLPGYLNACVDNCRAFGSLLEAQSSCIENQACLGITRVPWKRPEEQFELRGSTVEKPSLDGQVSFVVFGCRRKPIRTNPRGFRNEQPKDFATTKSSQSKAQTIEGTSGHEPEDDNAAVEEDLSYIKAGSFVGDRPTIFVAMASFKERACHQTIERALSLAVYPERLSFGIFDQQEAGEQACHVPDTDCEQDPTQALCKFRSQIRVIEADAADKQGATWARHRAETLYAGEYFVLLIEADMYFVKDWDEDIIHQWRLANNEHAILSTHPSDVRGNVDVEGLSQSETTPTVCRSQILPGNGMLRHQAAVEFKTPARIKYGAPVLQVWWSSMLSFSRGHRVNRVPFDCCTPFLYDGEEASMAIRAWTSGYDLYTFHHSVVFHPYSEQAPPHKHWENVDGYLQIRHKSEQRILHILKQRTTAPFDKSNLDRYGLGKQRSVRQFQQLFGVNFASKEVRDNCEAVTQLYLHDALTPYISSDSRGIDYTKVPATVYEGDFKTAALQARQRRGPYKLLTYSVNALHS